MKAQGKVSIIWATAMTLGITLGVGFTSPILAVDNPAQACLADLAKIDKNFCIGTDNSSTNGLDQKESLKKFQWTIDRETLLITGKICPKNSLNSQILLDSVLVLDRSASMSLGDESRAKIGQSADQMAEKIFNLFSTESDRSQGDGIKLGIVMGSTFSQCREYQGEAVTLDRDFTCVFIPARTLKNQGQKDLIAKLLLAAKGKFAQSQRQSSGIDDKALQMAADEKMGLSQIPGKKAVIILSDGRAYQSPEGLAVEDPYPYLRLSHYQLVASKQKSLLLDPKYSQLKIGYALVPSPEPLFGELYRDSMENICQIKNPLPPTKDCSLTSEEFRNPQNWSVNAWDPQKEIQGILSYSPENYVKKISGNQDLENLLEMVATNDLETIPINRVVYTVNGGAEQEGHPQGSRFTIGQTPIDFADKFRVAPVTNAKISFSIFSGSTNYKFNIETQLEKVKDQSGMKESELECPRFELAPEQLQKELNLRGGGVSCGTLGTLTKQEFMFDVFWWSLILTPLGLLGFKKGAIKITLFIFPLVTLNFAPPGYSAENNPGAEAQKNHMNVLTTRATVDGVGLPEKAMVTPGVRFKGGLFLSDSANSLNLTGQSGEETNLVDRLTVFHAVGSLRILKNLSLGIDVPVIYQAEIDRDTGQDRILRGKEGRSTSIGKVGDVEVRVKYQFTRLEHVAFGIMPIAQVPMGDEKLLLGEEKTVYGLKFLATGEFGQTLGRKNLRYNPQVQQFQWNANLGYLYRQKEIFKDQRSKPLEINSYIQFLASMDYRFPQSFSLGTQYEFRYQEQSVFGLNSSNPSELGLYGRYQGAGLWSLVAGAGVGIGEGVGAPERRIWTGMNVEI